jgi:hypothetical protein
MATVTKRGLYWRARIRRLGFPPQHKTFDSRAEPQALAHRHLANPRGADFAQYRDMRHAKGRAETTIRLELALLVHLFEIAHKEWGMESLLNPLDNIRKPSGSCERDRRLREGEHERISHVLEATANPCARQALNLAIELPIRIDVGRELLAGQHQGVHRTSCF